MTYIELHDIAKQELERYKLMEGLSPKLKRELIKQMRLICLYLINYQTK